MTYNTDGNLAALNAYQREQDAIADGEEYLERLQQELADDMFDAYVTGNSNVIDEVDDALASDERKIVLMRKAMTKECQRPVMGRGCELYETYWKLLDSVCLDIAKRCTTPDEFDKFRREFEL